MGVHIPLRGHELGQWLRDHGEEVSREEFNLHTPGESGLYGVAHVWNSPGLDVAAVADMERERDRLGAADRRKPNWYLVSSSAIKELLPDFPPQQLPPVGIGVKLF